MEMIATTKWESCQACLVWENARTQPSYLVALVEFDEEECTAHVCGHEDAVILAP